MKMKTYNLMIEALRRYCMFHPGEPLHQAWIGLGTEADYRPAIKDELMKWHDNKQPPPRCAGWLVLTEKGQEVIMRWFANGYYVKNHDGGGNIPPTG